MINQLEDEWELQPRAVRAQLALAALCLAMSLGCCGLWLLVSLAPHLRH